MTYPTTYDYKHLGFDFYCKTPNIKIMMFVMVYIVYDIIMMYVFFMI